MPDDVPQILPKGIVVNAPGLEDAIKRRGNGPLNSAEIHRFWQVYTTTTSALTDPTAERLENFWWRIWGSQWRELNASTVADIFTHISHGPTFVPLRGPPNRDEGGSNSLIIARQGPGGSSDTTLSPPHNSTAKSASAAKAPAVSPLPPILKKSRAPPTQGPRPSVGFASPSNSDDEDVSVSDASPAIEQPIEPQSATPDKKNRKPGGFIASSKKRRPIMMRRQSSQDGENKKNLNSPGSSTPVESSTKAKGKGKTLSKFQEQLSPPSSSLQQTSKSKGKGKVVSVSKFKEQFSPPTEKPLGNLYVETDSRSKTKTSDEFLISESAHLEASRSVAKSNPGPSTLQSQSRDLSSVALPEDSMTNDELRLQKTALGNFQRIRKNKLETAASNGDPGRSATQVVAIVDDSAIEENSRLQKDISKDFESQKNAERQGEKKRRTSSQSSSKQEGKLSVVERKGSASIGQSTTAATAQLALGGDSAGPVQILHPKDKSSEDDMFAKRPIPSSLAAATVPSPLGRSKSQLTLLLEKDKVIKKKK